MRVVTQPSINNVDNSTNINGAAINASQLINASFQIYNGDVSAEGTVKIQGSNDLPPAGQLAGGYVPTHWGDIPNATSAIAAGVGPLILISNMSFQWVRAVFTNTTPGSTTMSVVMNAQGI